jgi:ribosomal-protein-alanine N-acetyltransferase
MTSLPQAARIRRMTSADIDRVMEIAGSLNEAPQWPRSAYLTAMEFEATPRRIALVVEIPSGAKALAFLEPETARLKSCPDASGLLSSSSASDAEGEGVGVTGFAVASLLPPEAELELIAVDPAAQRRGLAHLLFAELAAELRAAQVNEMILEVRASNLPALTLYLSLGFVESGRRKDYYLNPVEDALLMHRFF